MNITRIEIYGLQQKNYDPPRQGDNYTVCALATYCFDAFFKYI